jgi:hypothetical protein
MHVFVPKKRMPTEYQRKDGCCPILSPFTQCLSRPVSLRGQTEEIKRLIEVLTTRLYQLLAVSGDPYWKEVLEKERQGASELHHLVVIKDH